MTAWTRGALLPVWNQPTVDAVLANDRASATAWVPQGGGVTGALIRSIDWSTSPVGPMSEWPMSLRVLVQTLLCSRHPMFLFWGPELIQFYNDAYQPSFGSGKHPQAMGQRGEDCWGEIWAFVSAQVDGVMSNGIPTWSENELVPIYRNGRIEEVFWTFGYSPAFGDHGEIAGALVVCTETTSGVLGSRRLLLMAQLAESVALASSTEDVLTSAFARFTEQTADLPFAAAFSTSDARLLTTHGVSSGAPEGDSIRARIEALGAKWVLTDAPRALPLDEPIAVGPWPEPVTQVFVAPLSQNVVLVFGTSPRLPFDEAYHGFMLQLVESLQAAAKRANAVATRLFVETERRGLLLQAPVAAALITGPDLVFELANPRFVEMVGREVAGRRYLEAFPEASGTPLEAVVNRVYQEGVPFATDEMRVPLVRGPNGKLDDQYFKFSLQPIRGDDNGVYGMMVIAVDITEIVRARDAQAAVHAELKRTGEERAALITQLEHANNAKDEFLAILGHELRNPLAPIVAALELTAMRNDGNLSREHKLIKRQVEHLVRLVDDLLDVARITRGKVELKKEVTEIGTVLGRAIEMAESLLEHRRHQLTVDVPEPLTWWGDPTRLAQVIANLLTNAARYTEPGGDIQLSARRDGDEICIAVTDNGNGIAPEMLDGVFDMFVQGRQQVDRAEGGLGLGLTLVKNLVELHDGTVSAMSAGVGQGSRFSIRLPATTGSFRPPQRLAAPPAVHKRVLVVDDNVDAAELITELLRMRGHTVEMAHDGATALDTFRRFQPDVAVLDIGLPVMDGYELARRIQALDGRPCRLIAVTGYGQRRDRERSAAAGFDEHLVKPVDSELLALAVVAPPTGADA